jgi:hypothetical protein
MEDHIKKPEYTKDKMHPVFSLFIRIQTTSYKKVKKGPESKIQGFTEIGHTIL